MDRQLEAMRATVSKARIFRKVSYPLIREGSRRKTAT
jgi:hypothetical protein